MGGHLLIKIILLNFASYTRVGIRWWPITDPVSKTGDAQWLAV
jgi:hypothetical protein